MTDRRVVFDFEVDFSNGGGVQGQDFRLDIDGDDIADDALAAHIIADLRLLMVGSVRILNKQIIEERHKRPPAAAADEAPASGRMIDLSHVIEHGMVTYKGLPAPLICDFLSREASRELYAPGTEFQIGQITLCSNTGTYMDTPFHRYADGADLSCLPLEPISNVPGIVVRVTGMEARAIDWTHFAASPVKGRAVLVHTGWDRNWRTDAYFEGHPYLTGAAAEYLRDQGAVLVGIDSFNIDDVSGGERSVHSTLLGAGIQIVEHMTGLDQLPGDGFRFFAVPPKVKGMGTFPVRAHAIIDATGT
ncbi:cyclase family protein [Sphingomonas cavernae]|uniref:Cyclase family protein n=1 Tax=Sphingomonas cavernae TaxID=2320861 RepID=A0A418WR84_9SPHN|nr:cyclase family protein [Sphingomonas cavernae]RJF93770.1 cyclase family protein [Sphingomonas cavernae]